jgi:ribosomal protein L11 methyltransferase
MKWIEVEIGTSGDAADAIIEKLIILGAYGISSQDPGEIKAILDSPDSLTYADEGYVDSLGEEVVIKAYFSEFPDGVCLGIKYDENENFLPTDVLYHFSKDQKCSVDELMSFIEASINDVSQFLDIGNGSLKMKYIADEDWANCWKKYFHPMKISDRIIIAPSWEVYEPESEEKIVLLDPGSAFGTGSHATTAMCADILDRVMSVKDASELKILDLGCGSGILSVIAAKLGSRNIDAVDLDEMAVDVARENCSKNEVSEFVNCIKGEASDLKGNKYDIVVANIIADVIAAIAPQVKELLKDDGIFITSGIINTKKQRVLDKYLELGFGMIEEIEKDEWIAYKFIP